MLKKIAWNLSLLINDFKILNKWGKLIGVKRKLFERNNSYRIRLVEHRTGKKCN